MQCYYANIILSIFIVSGARNTSNIWQSEGRLLRASSTSLYVSLKFIRSVLRCQSEQDRPAVPGASSFSVGLPVFTQFPQPPTFAPLPRVSIKGRQAMVGKDIWSA